MGALIRRLLLWRVYILIVLLSVLVAVAIHIHATSNITASQRGDFLFPRVDFPPIETTKKRFEISLKPWGADPFISPIVEENLKRQREEALRRKKEEEERRRKEEELLRRRQKEEEERKKREEEERRKKQEEERRREEEERKRKVSKIASRMLVKGVLHLTEGTMVIIGDNGYRVGDKIEADGEKFRLIEIKDEFVIIEDRFGRRHKVRILE